MSEHEQITGIPTSTTPKLGATDHPMQKVRDVRSKMSTVDFGSRLFCENFLPALGRRFPLYISHNPFSTIEATSNVIHGKTILEPTIGNVDGRGELIHESHTHIPNISAKDIETCKQAFIGSINGKVLDILDEKSSSRLVVGRPDGLPRLSDDYGSSIHVAGLSQSSRDIIYEASLRQLESDALQVQYGYPIAVGYAQRIYRAYSAIFDARYNTVFRLKCSYVRLIKPENVCVVCLADGRTLLYARPGDVHIFKNYQRCKYAVEAFSGYSSHMDGGHEYHPSIILRMLSSKSIDNIAFVRQVGLVGNERSKERYGAGSCGPESMTGRTTGRTASSVTDPNLKGRRTYAKSGDVIDISLYVRSISLPKATIEENRFDRERKGAIQEYAEEFNPFLYKPGQFEKTKAIQKARTATSKEEVQDMIMDELVASAILRAWETETIFTPEQFGQLDSE